MKPNEIICPTCNGDGYQPGEEFCKTCGGGGTITREKLKKITDEKPQTDDALDKTEKWILEQQIKRRIK